VLRVRNPDVRHRPIGKQQQQVLRPLCRVRHRGCWSRGRLC
jgi:hypothetical protein